MDQISVTKNVYIIFFKCHINLDKNILIFGENRSIFDGIFGFNWQILFINFQLDTRKLNSRAVAF